VQSLNQFEIEVTMKESSRNYVGILPEKMFEILSSNQEIIDSIIDKTGWPDESTVISVALIEMWCNLGNDVVQLNDKDMKLAASIMNKDSKSFSSKHAVRRALIYYCLYLKELHEEIKSNKHKAKRLKKK
jgi:hypothetical protein